MVLDKARFTVHFERLPLTSLELGSVLDHISSEDLRDVSIPHLNLKVFLQSKQR